MRNTYLAIYFTLGFFVQLDAQINYDYENIKKRQIKEISIENGDCIYHFNSSGILIKMVINSSSSTEIYRFLENGSWITYVQLDSVGSTAIKRSEMSASYKDDGELIYNSFVYYDGVKPDCPIKVDSFTYQNTESDNWIKYSKSKKQSSCSNFNDDGECDCIQLLLTEDEEFIENVAPNKYRINYYTVKNGSDTLWGNSLEYKTINDSQISTVTFFSGNTYDTVSTCVNCSELGNNFLLCDCTRIGQSKIKTKLQITHLKYSKEELYSELPKSRSTVHMNSYAVNPWILYKASKKIYGSGSVNVKKY